MKISAYIPCFNNAKTLRFATESVLAQSVKPDEVLVIDDGSVDESTATLAGLAIRIIRHERNLGRGAVRARAMQEARNELVLCCDATNVIPEGFTQRALQWFGDARVAAVCGRIVPPAPDSLADRWRARHLFLFDKPAIFSRTSNLATTAAILRRSAALAVGNFDRRLRHTEDGELGWRLAAANYEILFDPDLHVIPRWSNPLGKVLERHWRWYAGVDENVTPKSYFKSVGYSIKVMARDDLERGDWPCALVSLLAPHHHLCKTVARRIRGDENGAGMTKGA